MSELSLKINRVQFRVEEKESGMKMLMARVGERTATLTGISIYCLREEGDKI